jgi:hypothetical protein
MKQAAKLSDIQLLSIRCQQKATPHRVPDFKKLKSLVDGDPEITGSMVFLEEHNTGYDGVLYRYILQVADTKIQFQVDLLPGDLTNEE